MIPNASNLSLIPTTQQVYIAMTWDDLKTVCLIAGIICLIAGYAINELWHRHNAKKEESE